MGAFLSYFVVSQRGNDKQNFSFIQIWNLRCVFPEVKRFGKYLPYWSLNSWGFLLTHWQPMTSILFGIVRICSSLFKCNYLKDKKNSEVLLPFIESSLSLNDFRKKMMVITNLFPILQNVKSWSDHSLKSVVSQHPLTVNYLKGCQTLKKSAWEHFYHIFSSLWMKMIRKISPLLNFQIIGVFFNTLTGDDKYPVQYCENLQFPIQMQLS